MPLKQTYYQKPENYILQNALIRVLQIEMNDVKLTETDQSWIEYFIWELNFGKENHKLNVTENGKIIKMKTAANLYDFLINR